MVFFGGAAFLAFGAAAFFFGGIVGVEARRLRKRRWFVSAVIGCGEKVSQKSMSCLTHLSVWLGAKFWMSHENCISGLCVSSVCLAERPAGFIGRLLFNFINDQEIKTPAACSLAGRRLCPVRSTPTARRL